MHARIAGLIAVVTVAAGIFAPRPVTADVPAPPPPPAHAQPAPLPAVHVDVTGDPAPVETLRLAILNAARAAVPDAQDAVVSLAETAPPLAPLPPATQTALLAVVQVAVEGIKPVVRTVPVEIRNDAVPWSDAQELLVSNSPETLAFGKVLMHASIGSGETARLLYHHANGAPDRRMTVGVELSNPAHDAIALWVTGAAGTAGADELSVGHAAARAFLDQYWHHAGFMLRVPGNTTVSLFVHDLAPGGVASGLTQVTLVEGERANLQVYARLQGEMDPPPMSFAPDADRIHTRGTFLRPQVVRPLHYTVGGTFAMTLLGDDHDALLESQSQRALSGNYGVVYSFPTEVSNPDPTPATLSLIMQAVGGQTSGTVLLDDRIIDVPRIPGGESRVVGTIHLAPGEHRTVMISAMPEPGANYPVRLSLGAGDFH